MAPDKTLVSCGVWAGRACYRTLVSRNVWAVRV